MNKFLINCAILLCLVSRCALGQYQTAPAYSTSQQRKMAPNPMGYGNKQQQSGSSMGYESERLQQMQDRNNLEPMMLNQYDNQQQSNMDATSGSGYSSNNNNNNNKMSSSSSGYGNQQSLSGKQSNGYGAMDSGNKYEEPQHPPMPFSWGYDIDDGYGGTQYHKENGDECGKRTGSYGYMDAYGVYRNVYYVADKDGFRATIKTNEPGTANESPADVELHAEEPPANVFMGNKNSYNSDSSSSTSKYDTTSASSGSNSGKQYGSQSSMPDDVSANKQYGAAMQKAMGGGDSSNQQYGSGSSMDSMSTRGQYGGVSGMPRSTGSSGKRFGTALMGLGGTSGQYGQPKMTNDGTTSQYGSSGMTNGQNSGSLGQYKPMSSSQSGNSGSQYGSMNENMNANSGSYGSGGASMMFGQYGPSTMGSGRPSGAKYEQSMMATKGATSGGQYGSSMGANNNAQYGSAMMGARNNGGNSGAQYGLSGMMSGSARGKSRRYSSTSMARADQYGSSNSMGMDDAQQYMMSSMIGGDMNQNSQQYGSSGLMSGTSDKSQQQYGMDQSGMSQDELMSMMQQYGSGPASSEPTSVSGQSGSLPDHSAQTQQYGTAQPSANVDAASNYSSNRLQSSYGNGSRPGENSNKSSAYGTGQSGTGMKIAQQQLGNIMDYRKAAGRGIAALAKRY